MSDRDRQRSKEYFFNRPVDPRRIENRVNEPADIAFARDTMNPPDLTQAWTRAPPNIQPLSRLGRLLGGADIKQPSPQEVARYLADIQTMNRPWNFSERWVGM